MLSCVQVDEVKGIMMQNVEQVLVRGERLDVLVDRTDDLRDQVGMLGLVELVHLFLFFFVTNLYILLAGRVLVSLGHCSWSGSSCRTSDISMCHSWPVAIVNGECLYCSHLLL